MSMQSTINRDIFVPLDQKLLVAIEVKRRNRRKLPFLSAGRKYATFICLSATNKLPAQLFITKVKQFEGSPRLSKTSHWTIEQLRQVDGINPNKDCPEFDLAFERTFDQWVAGSEAEKCMFIQILYQACQNYWMCKDGQTNPGEVKDPQKPGKVEARKGPTVPRTSFINCQSKLMEDACSMNMVIYRCKIFLNQMKSAMRPPPQRRPAGQGKSAGVKSRTPSPARPARGSMKKAVRRASQALGERGDRLWRAEDKTAHMKDSAKRFSDSAHKLALKYSC
ncbi:syntaxin binding protein 6 (amisyn), like isoform X1 [Alosa sapidissima]|uniref:syntaxin binding protein 6 (amisyn), like isoform X1 n=1 Tax=Alosa sapidissima TaxID=34773 RepID=UPI001C09D00A|nr:syntaxin binding protein 6 (amisyn), like isoform X1 [Alosa sapidissima]